MKRVDSWKKRRIVEKAERYVSVANRYLDLAVEWTVIDRDPEGSPLIPGIDETHSVVGIYREGGLWDSVANHFIGPARKYVPITISRKQWELISDTDGKRATLLFGGEGASKTNTGAFKVIRWLINSGHKRRRKAGVTAPSQERLDEILDFLRRYIPESWGFFRAKKSEWVFRNNLTIKFIGTKAYSAALGSRVAGYNWIWCLSDEVQDTPHSVLDDIEARGRAAPGGIFPRFCTATPKLDGNWFEYRAKIQTLPSWQCLRITGPENLWVPARFWEERKRELSPNEYKRRVLALDVKPDSSVYSLFNPDTHIKKVPGDALDITYQVSRRQLVIGHDPGLRQNVSILLKCYLWNGLKTWWVVDEFITKQTTTETHANRLKAHLQKYYKTDLPPQRDVPTIPPKSITMVDPGHIKDAETQLDIVQLFRAAGLDAYRAVHGNLKKETRIELMQSMFENAAGETTLYIAGTPDKPKAPTLVRSLELDVYDERFRAETNKGHKEKDFSDAPSATAYGLIYFVRPPVSGLGYGENIL